MKKIIFVLMCIVVMLLNTVAFADDIYIEDESFSLPEVKAESAILMDMKTGRVIYSKNPHERRYPASTTKIMTAILALELGNMSDVVTADVASLAPITNEDSHMGILIGEELTMEQLINGMMVYSANDASNVIATHIAGSSEHFVDLMNKKAQDLGTTDTNFVNTYGIHDENHYTTASDLAVITRYAMENQTFRDIVKQKTYAIPATNKYTTDRLLTSTNLFVGTARSGKYYYSAVTGVKTGHTSDAGYCLVSTAEKNGTELLCIVMKCDNQDACYTTSRGLIDYGFKNYEYRTVVAAGDVVSDSKVIEAKNDERVGLTVDSDVAALLPSEGELSEIVEVVIDLPEKIKAPIKKGDVIGKVSYNYKGNLLEYRDLIATNDVERNILLFIFNLVVGVLTSPFFLIPAILIVAALIIRAINIKKHERQKRLRRLHSRQSQSQTRTGTKRPVNTRFEDKTRRRPPGNRRK